MDLWTLGPLERGTSRPPPCFGIIASALAFFEIEIGDGPEPKSLCLVGGGGEILQLFFNETFSNLSGARN